ncbi:MAG: restriction endonuclease [Clostridia bacterium]|nr:restriction endonuclease [Clostridia bacterium]
MAKIANARGRSDGGSGYTRVLKNDELGVLVSRVQATVISNGNELERLILERTNNIDNLDNFIDETIDAKTVDGVYLCPKRVYAKSRYLIYDNQNNKIEPDLLIFIVEQRRICKVVELKDGDAFDTKKSAGEKQHLEEFVLKFGSQIPFVAEYYICCFNQTDKNIIFTGFKGAFDMAHILTGRDLCNILRINYDEIVEKRKADAEDNFEYFLNQLIAIDEVNNYLKNKLKAV